MTEDEILRCLCIYDPMNPDCDYDEEEIEEHKNNDCYCDNCFYGRTKLAKEILKSKGY